MTGPPERNRERERGRGGPKALGDILGALFASRGYGRLRGVSELERAWADAVGEPACRQTRVGAVRRGVLTVTVAHPALLEELAAFRKVELLAALRRDAPGSPVRDLRFRIGPIDDPPDPEPPPPTPPAPTPPRRRRS